MEGEGGVRGGMEGVQQDGRERGEFRRLGGSPENWEGVGGEWRRLGGSGGGHR